MKLVLAFLILTHKAREASLILEPAGLSLDRVMTSNILLCNTSTLEGGFPGILFWRICKIIVKTWTEFCEEVQQKHAATQVQTQMGKSDAAGAMSSLVGSILS